MSVDRHYSIGEIAERTGITVDTVRVWERRYGRPVPVRLPSGHRRYTEDHLVWLRRVAEALALGRRAGEGALSSINLAVDACNAVSLASGLPISVVDLDRATAPLSVRVAPPETSYVFNASGQEIRIDGLVALFDADGACANAVKDSQRTKTHDGTRRALSIVWGTSALPGRTEAATRWYRALLEECGAQTRDAEETAAR